MSKQEKIARQKEINKIYEFDVKGLCEHASKKDKLISCPERICNNSQIRKIIPNNIDSLLFNQARRVLPDVPFRKIFASFNFSRMLESDILDLKNYENGFKIFIDTEEYTFVEFIKSSSMSRNKKCFYINTKYLDLFQPLIDFGFDLKNNKIKVSKWYAYSGLVCSSADICSNLILNNDEVAVVDDKESLSYGNFITAISTNYLYESLKDFEHALSNDKFDNLAQLPLSEWTRYQDLYRELTSYMESVNYKDLTVNKNGMGIKDILDSYYSCFSLTQVQAITRLREIKNKYRNCENATRINRNGKTVPVKVEWYEMNVDNWPATINHFDGTGIITKEMAKEIKHSIKKSNKKNKINYTFQIRLPFMKGVVHACDFKDFFAEHNVTKIKSIKNFNAKSDEEKYEYKDVSSLKMIVTKSQFKGAQFLKFITKEQMEEVGANSQIDYYFKLVQKYKYPLAIANEEYNEVEDSKLNYQFLSTLPLHKEETEYLINNSKKRILDSIKEENLVSEVTNFESHYSLDDLMYTKCKDFYLSTYHYKELREDVFMKEKCDAITGKATVHAYRRFLAPDLLDLLYHIIGVDIPKEQELPLYKVFIAYNNREKKMIEEGHNFNDETVLLLRNPHYSRNEIAVSKRDANDDNERSKYFGHLKGVVMINPRSFVADRLGGADYDGDSVLIVNDWNFANTMKHRLLIKNSDGKYDYKYKCVKIPSLLEENKYLNHNNTIESFCGTFSNATGVISNLAFEKVINAYKDDNNLYDKIAFYTLLSGLEIDSAKTGRQPKLGNTFNMEKPIFIKIKDAIKKDYKTKYNPRSDKFDEELVKSCLNDLKDMHSLYYFINNVMNIEYPKLENTTKKPEKLLNLPKCNLDNSYAITLGILDGIKKINKIISTFKPRKNGKKSIKGTQQYFIDELSSIDSKIRNILEDNSEYSLEEYIDLIKMNNENLSDRNEIDKLIHAYCNATNKYHFMNKYSDKLDFITSLGLKLDDNLQGVLFNFANHGFELLFLTLMYLYYSSEPISFNYTDAVTNCYVKKYDDLSDEYKEVFSRVSKELFDYVNSKVNFRFTTYYDAFEYIKLFIETNYKDNVSFEILSFIETAHSNELLFSIFEPEARKYFMELGEVK